jgi:hypothetical protein
VCSVIVSLRELLDVGLRLLVCRHRGAHLLGERLARFAQLLRVDRDVEEPSEPFAERLGGARVRRQRDVVGHRRPQAGGREACDAAGVVEHADDPRGPLVARGLQPEALDQVRVARAPGHRGRACVRNVGEQRAESDHELDVELLGEVDDQLREGLPAHVGLVAGEQDGIALGPGKGRVPEGGLRPLDLACDALHQRDMRTRHLEVEEALGVDLRKAVRVPELRQVARCERGALAAVVPAAEGGHEDRAAQLGPLVGDQLVTHSFSLGGSVEVAATSA